MSIPIKASIVEANDVRISLTIEMSSHEWKLLRGQIGEGWPGFVLTRAIDKAVAPLQGKVDAELSGLGQE